MSIKKIEKKAVRDAMLTIAYKSCDNEIKEKFKEIYMNKISKYFSIYKYNCDEHEIYIKKFAETILNNDKVSEDLISIVKDESYDDVFEIVSNWEEDDFYYKDPLSVLLEDEYAYRSIIEGEFVNHWGIYYDDFKRKIILIKQNECEHIYDNIEKGACYDKEFCPKCNKILRLIELEHNIFTNCTGGNRDCFREECKSCGKIFTPWRWKDIDGNWTGTQIYTRDQNGKKINISPSFLPYTK
jgi:hypothetical protein